jgi:hypothetical protein
LPIADEQLAILVADTREETVLAVLHPLNIEDRLLLSTISLSKVPAIRNYRTNSYNRRAFG